MLCTLEEKHLVFIVYFGLILLQFEPVAGDLSSERTRSRELAEKIAKRDPLDVNKVLYQARLCSLIATNICVALTRSLMRVLFNTVKIFRQETATCTKGEVGGGYTSLYGLYWYVQPQRVWFFSRFGHKQGIEFLVRSSI